MPSKKSNIYYIPSFVTLAIFAIGIIVALKTDESLGLFEWAQYWACLVSAGALVWLVFGYLQQGEAIEIQNEQIELYKLDLHNQQKQIELQSAELKKMSFASSLAHIRDMMSIAQKDYQKSKKPRNSLYLNKNIKPIFESTDPREVFQNCQEWQEEYLHYQLFIKRIRDAAEFYFISNGIKYNTDYTNNDSFLYVNSPWFSKTPYIADAYNSVSMQINLNSQMADIPKQVTLAAFSAQWFLQKNLIKVDQLHKDASIFSHDQQPAIYKKLLKQQEEEK